MGCPTTGSRRAGGHRVPRRAHTPPLSRSVLRGARAANEALAAPGNGGQRGGDSVLRGGLPVAGPRLPGVRSVGRTALGCDRGRGAVSTSISLPWGPHLTPPPP